MYVGSTLSDKDKSVQKIKKNLHYLMDTKSISNNDHRNHGAGDFVMNI